MKVLSMAVDDETHRVLKVKAAQKGTSMAAILRDYLKRMLLEEGYEVPEEMKPWRRA